MASPSEPSTSEGALVRRLLDREEAAFLEVVDRYHTGLLRVAQSFVRTRASAEEVVQETWSAFIEALDTFEQRSSIKTFLYRIVANQARTRAVKDQRMLPMSDLERDGDDHTPLADRFGTAGNWLAPPSAWAAENAETIVERKQAMAVLAREMEQLPERQRAVVQLRDVEGLAADEVCTLLDISEVHQRVLLHRARTRLRVALEAHFRE